MRSRKKSAKRPQNHSLCDTVIIRTNNPMHLTFDFSNDVPEGMPQDSVRVDTYVNGFHVGKSGTTRDTFAELMQVPWERHPCRLFLTLTETPIGHLMGTWGAYIPTTLLPWVPFIFNSPDQVPSPEVYDLDGVAVGMLPLGAVVRSAHKRIFGRDLAREAGNLLEQMLRGELVFS